MLNRAALVPKDDDDRDARPPYGEIAQLVLLALDITLGIASAALHFSHRNDPEEAIVALFVMVAALIAASCLALIWYMDAKKQRDRVDRRNLHIAFLEEELRKREGEKEEAHRSQAEIAHIFNAQSKLQANYLTRMSIRLVMAVEARQREAAAKDEGKTQQGDQS